MGLPQRKINDGDLSDTRNKSRTRNVNRVNKTRNARINDDWGYLNKSELSSHPTTDETFNAAYDEKGIKSTPKEKGKDKQKVINLAERRQQREGRKVHYKNTRNKKSKPGGLISGAISMANKTKWKVRVSAVNMSILPWYLWVWLTLQLTFGIIGLIAFGLAFGIEAGVKSNFITRSINSGVEWVTSGLGKLGNATGVTESADTSINLAYSAALLPLSIYMLTYIIIFVIGMFFIFMVFFRYELAFLRPLSGEKASLKMGAFYAVVILYCIPLVNIFPWLLLWMYVVWKYPR